MRQVIRRGFNKIGVEEVPDPLPRHGHVIVQPSYSLISSGTEGASLHRGSIVKLAASKPQQRSMVLRAAREMGPLRTLAEVRARFDDFAVLGYSGAGLVIAKHDSVVDLNVGDRVAYGGEGTGHCERVLAGRNLVARIPENVTFREACFTTLGSIAMNATRIARVELGDVVAVFGAGLVGQLVNQVVRCHGGRVVSVDLLPERVKLAVELGAEEGAVGIGAAEAAIERLSEGRGADCVIVAAAAKSAEPCRQALQVVRDRGRLVVVGAVEMSFPWLDMYLKEVQLYMARAYGPGSYDPSYEDQGHDYPLPYVRWTENRNMEEFLRLVGDGHLRLEKLITHEFELDDAPGAYEQILDQPASTLAVVLRYPSSPPTTTGYEPKRRVEVTRPVKPRGGDRQLGVGVIGAGNLAKWEHLPNLKRAKGVALRAICSSNGVRGKSYANRFGAEYCCSDYDEMLDDPQVEAVVIATRNQHHAAQTIAALEAGKHVFVEKPLALTEEECRRIGTTARKAGLQVAVGFNRRFADLYAQQQEAVRRRSGPALVSCRVSSPGISGDYWMADPAIGGAILGEACHFVDLMYWFVGAEIRSVSATSFPIGRGEPIGQNNLVASLAFADGSVGSLSYGTVGAGTSESVEALAQGLRTRSEDFKRLEVRIEGRPVQRKSKLFAAKGYREQLDDFFESIRSGEPPGVTVADGIRATVVCLAIMEAANSGSVCEVAWESILDQE